MQRLLCRRIVPAVFLALFFQPLGRCEPLSVAHSRQVAGAESISIVRVEEDLLVRWFCPAFQKTSLLTLNADGEWRVMDDACAAVPETQYSSLRRDLQQGFFRTSAAVLQEFPRLRIMMPSGCISGLPTPIRIEVLRGDGTVDWEVWEGEVSLSFGSGSVSPASLVLHNGMSSGLLPGMAACESQITASYNGESVSKNLSGIQVTDEVTVAGELSDLLTVWKPGDGVIRVTGDVSIPAGHVLRIYPDTIVLLDPKKSITVRGAIESLGTVEHPVLFAAANPGQPWGEISHTNASTNSVYRGTFFIGGGDSPGAGHTGRGPVIRVSHAGIEFDHCNIMDNYGKGLYGSNGDLTFTHCLLSRSAMGMEVVDTDIVVDRCFFTEMPMGGDIADNDPLYLNGQGDMSVTNSIFAVGGDDGIDTLSSAPAIENCIIHGFLDKGISVFYGTPRIKNCLVFSNEYGISAKGDGTDVYVDRVTILNNTRQDGEGAGLRCHNKYNDPDAVIKYFVTNSIIWNNDHAIMTDYPPEDITITYSVVQGAELFPGEGNINDDPLFVDPDANNFRLDENSPCRGAGQNGVDMGFVYPDMP